LEVGVDVETICGCRSGGDGARAYEWREVRDGSADVFDGQVYAILDEVFLAGEIEETSKQVVLTRLEHLDKLE
jgi:hypothetical protein